jgi:hypothetical protein
MKKTIGIIGILLFALATTAIAGPKPTAISAKLAYQEGLFFQRTVGNLEKALQSYDRALEVATKVEDSDLLESILLRRAECFKLLGKDNQQQTTIAALQKETKTEAARLGVARYFPPESDMIIQVDLAALLSAPLLEKLNVKAEIDPKELEQAIQILGFDPLKDLHKITMGVTISDSETMPAEHWLIHAEGDLADFRLDRLIESTDQLAPGVLPRTRKIHGENVLVMKVPLPKEKIKVMTIGVAFLGKDGVLAGDLKAVKSTLAARAGKAPGLSANPKLAGLTGQVPKESTFWLAGVPTQIIRKIEKMGRKKIPGLPANLPEVAGLMLSGRITEDLEAVGLAFTEDLQSARMLGDIFKGVLALAQLVPTDEPVIAKFLGSLKVEIKEREVKVSITLPGELIAQEECCPKKKRKPCCPEAAKRQSKGKGSLSINSNPWSTVFIDGKKVGNTPVLRIKLKAGRHEVILENKGQGIQEKLKIVIEAGKETKIMKILKKK